MWMPVTRNSSTKLHLIIVIVCLCQTVPLHLEVLAPTHYLLYIPGWSRTTWQNRPSAASTWVPSRGGSANGGRCSGRQRVGREGMKRAETRREQLRGHWRKARSKRFREKQVVLDDGVVRKWFCKTQGVAWQPAGITKWFCTLNYYPGALVDHDLKPSNKTGLKWNSYILFKKQQKDL